jgi:hypothetical protein
MSRIGTPARPLIRRVSMEVLERHVYREVVWWPGDRFTVGLEEVETLEREGWARRRIVRRPLKRPKAAKPDPPADLQDTNAQYRGWFK